MPKQTRSEQTQTFSREEWVGKVKEKLTDQWASAVMWNNGTLFVEVVRVSDTDDIMVRVRTANIKNALKLTRREHIDALIELAEAVVANERNLRDKLEALREELRAGGRRVEEV